MASPPTQVAGRYPITPDGRYFVVRGRLWRLANPALTDEAKATLTKRLMSARRDVQAALRAGDGDAEALARAAVDEAKRALGERGAPWWTDGAPDFNRRLARNTPYAEWLVDLPGSGPEKA